MADLKKEFWDRIEDVQAGMLGFASDNRLVPMSPQIDKDDHGHIWFITAHGTDLVNGTEAGPQPAKFVICDQKAGLHADIEGTLSLSGDRAKLDKIWSVVAAAWFEDDKQDPDVRLLCFKPAKAEVWETSTSGIKFFYEIAKANLTDTKPDAGKQGTITF